MATTIDIRIRQAENNDCPTIVNFIRAALQHMESVGGHEVNHDVIRAVSKCLRKRIKSVVLRCGRIRAVMAGKPCYLNAEMFALKIDQVDLKECCSDFLLSGVVRVY